MLHDPLLNKTFLQPSNDQIINKYLKRREEMLEFRDRRVGAEGNDLTLEMSHINIEENLKILGLSYSNRHVVASIRTHDHLSVMPCRGHHPTTLWQMVFPKNHIFHPLKSRVDPI